MMSSARVRGCSIKAKPLGSQQTASANRVSFTIISGGGDDFAADGYYRVVFDEETARFLYQTYGQQAIQVYAEFDNDSERWALAFPRLTHSEWRSGEWLTLPDRDGCHYAMKKLVAS